MGKANVPADMRFMATPIHEFSDEYDSRSNLNRSAFSS